MSPGQAAGTDNEQEKPMPVNRTIRRGAIPLWMLNDASSVSEKIEYMRACRRGGIEALCMHPRCGNLVPYGSDEWFEMIRRLVEEGRRLDMDMWLYDEDPFPSGAAGGLITRLRPDLRALALTRHERPPGLGPGRLWPIGEDRVIWAGLVPVREPLPAIDLTARVGVVRVDWFMTDWDSRYYYPQAPLFPCPRGSAVRTRFVMRVPELPEGYELVAITAKAPGEDGPWDSLPDLLNYETFGLFKELVLERYAAWVGEHFGTTIPGIFTDEPKAFGAVSLTADLFESFQDTFGYDLRGRLYQLFGEPLGEQYAQTRLDYRTWLGRRFLEAFMRPYRRWCDAHGLHLVGHISPEDDPLEETPCVGSVMPVMKELSLPGTDIIVPFTGDSRAPGLNLGSVRVSSLKAQHGRPCATSETLALCGWSTTTDRCRQLLTWQKVLGVDRFFLHGFFNSSEGVVNYEAPPDYGPNSSIFKGICALNEWLKDVEAVMDGAQEVAELAVLNSMPSFWTWGPGMEESRLHRLRRSLWQTIVACLQAHVGLHIVDEEDLSGARLDGGRLVVGNRSYGCVVAPALDVVESKSLDVLGRAAQEGVSVFWFGGGPARMVGQGHRLESCVALPGTVLRQQHPAAAWCRRHFRPQATLRGAGREQCYVRRVRSTDGEHYLLAVSLSDGELALRLAAEDGGRAWVPVRADGETRCGASATLWRVPGRGCGLFRLSARAPSAARRAERVRRPAGEVRTFRRLGPNVLRLAACTVSARGKAGVQLDYPRPYWQVWDDYSTRRTCPTFLGELPVESTVPAAELRYGFRFAVRGEIKGPRLVLDPRCARGRFDIVLNGERIGRRRRFPLEGARPLRVPLRKLKRGVNRLELLFRPESAMDGLLSQLYVEGDFDVDLAGRTPTLVPPAGRDSRDGWQEAGAPHYMGEGRYEWRENFTAEDLRVAWTLEADRIVDSAELFVNGESAGVRAWAPWRWELPNVRRGANTFSLVVSGTAGNKHELRWPNEPQGWIGRARLVGSCGEEAGPGGAAAEGCPNA